MNISASKALFPALLIGSLFLSGCASDYGRGPHGSMDWEARHMEAHRHMMGYPGAGACPMDGMGGMGMGMGPGSGTGQGPGAMMTPEQQRAMMAAQIKNMPPELLKRRMELMEMQMQMMREHMASQPAASPSR